MTTKMRRAGKRTVAGALIAAGPVIAACSLGPSYDEWAATDGAAGRIILRSAKILVAMLLGAATTIQ